MKRYILGFAFAHLFLTIFLTPTPAQKKPSRKPATQAQSGQNSVPRRPASYPAQLDKASATRIFAAAGFNYNPEKQWQDVLGGLDNYKQLTATSPEYKVFAHQMMGIADISFSERAMRNGWAGDFVLLSFLVAADDIKKNLPLWHDQMIFIKSAGETIIASACISQAQKQQIFPTPQTIFEALLDAGLNSVERRSVCMPLTLALRHFERHLGPAFKIYIKTLLTDVATNSHPEDRYLAIEKTLLNLRKEHTLFIEKAIKPAFWKNPAAGIDDKLAALYFPIFNVAASVQSLREKTVEAELKELQGSKLLTNQEVEKIISNHSRCHCVY